MSIGAISGFGGAQAAQRPSFDEMKAQFSSLKSSNPDLANKMEKIGNRAQELQKSGKSDSEIQDTIMKEFGKPSESDMQSMKSAFGSRGSSGGPSGVSQKDMESMISRLKQSNPQLADKLEKAGHEVQTLKKSGKSDSEIQSTMQKEFGSLSDSDKQSLSQLFGQNPSGGSFNSSGGSSSSSQKFDLSAYAQTKNESLQSWFTQLGKGQNKHNN